MKNLIFSFASACLFLMACVQANAAIIRVDNTPGNLSTYSTAQAAHNAASAGDTLYFVGTGINYGDLTLTKKLIIYGPGYFLTQNPETQANPNDALLNTVTYNSGSSGSLITGIHMVLLRINTDNIIVKRNYIYYDYYYAEPVIISNNRSNIYLLQNYMARNGGANSNNYVVLAIGSGGSNIFVQNNLIIENLGYWAMTCASSITLSHNVIRGTMSISSSTIDHNIQESGGFSGSGNSTSYNIGNSTQFGTANGNQSSVTMTDVFTYLGSTDGKYQIKSSGPADGAGASGADIGAFGGVEPYVLSGMPAIPAIYYYNAPSTGSAPTGLPITIKVKSHN